MTPDESTPIDEGLLTALLAFDAARVESRVSDFRTAPVPSTAIPPDLSGFLDLIQRLESYEPETTASPESAISALCEVAGEPRSVPGDP